MEIDILAKHVLDHPMECGVWVNEAFPGLRGGTWLYFNNREYWKDHVEGSKRSLSGLSGKPGRMKQWVFGCMGYTLNRTKTTLLPMFFVYMEAGS
jgi:hypothetical protein